jgi:hypothetical protein
MVAIPGEYKSFGHDYRGDTLDFVGAAYDFPSFTEEQAETIHETLVRRELQRAERVKMGASEEPFTPVEAKGSIQ